MTQPLNNNITGQTYGMLTVLKRANNRNRHTFWLCKCECGNEKEIPTYNLQHGLTKSCGCYRKQVSAETLRKRAFADKRIKRIHRIHYSMKKRCYDPKCNDYKYYGGRGIGICKEWMNPEAFTSWALANGYQDNLSIDRIDYNKDYEPSNCRWVSIKIQANNKRNNRIVCYYGEKYTLSQLAEKYGLAMNTLRMRLEYGWTLEEAVNIPVGRLKNRTKRRDWQKCQK